MNKKQWHKTQKSKKQTFSQPFLPPMSTPLSNYATCVKRLLIDLEYRYEPPPSHDANYWDLFHHEKRLDELEHAAGSTSKRAYPYASTELQLLFAKVTALGLLIDDSIQGKLPRYLRVKGGASESYVAGILKATKEQNLPFSKYYIKAVPDAVFISVGRARVR
ncbi:hypothetical protein B0H13DRAFT_2478591, partial [Mycena leptocephala]